LLVFAKWNVVPSAGPTPPQRRRWTSAQFAYLALALNGLCLLVLFANLLLVLMVSIIVTNDRLAGRL